MTTSSRTQPINALAFKLPLTGGCGRGAGRGNAGAGRANIVESRYQKMTVAEKDHAKQQGFGDA